MCKTGRRGVEDVARFARPERRRERVRKPVGAESDPGTQHEPAEGDGHAGGDEQALVQADPGEPADHAGERDQLRALLQVARPRDVRHAVGRGGAAHLLLLLGREQLERVLAATKGDERLRNGGVELCADVALDLGECLLLGKARAIRPVARHRVEAVGHDEEVGGERLVGGRDAVVAAAVEALTVVLDGASLGRRDLEATE